MRNPKDQEAATTGDSITAETFARARAIFEAALERPEAERLPFVEGACVGDPAMLLEVGKMLAADAQAGVLLDTPISRPPSSAPEEGRFPAGTVLAGRYRILGQLGKGGMGEVYRAHDLILNQTVALKFLVSTRISEAALLRFRNEVRIARQVSHPNVCRVYDMGMAEGMHFLSMEYIDGEDLASLLRRIGRLPQDKAIEFTRKICAGLSAAHERGVLHRDLKPANIMIDGRGQVLITDFGLAGLAAEIPLSDLRSGTPAYMSPEQKAGKEVTVRSDLYALGLVLHELFTGRRRGDTQTTPSDIVKDLDLAVERLILRCLEEDPRQRPTSALSVAMALPGGDPIAAALAAGETPSPEMVAASTTKEGLSTRTAVLLFIATAILVGLNLVSANRSRLLQTARLDIPPDGLAFRAQDLLKQFGYTGTPRTTAYGFECCDLENLRQANELNSMERDAVLSAHQPPVIHYWYRQHESTLWPDAGIDGIVTFNAPENTEPGMVRVLLDPKGRLLSLEGRPRDSNASTVAEPDWSVLFTAAGLDSARFTTTSPQQLPPMAFDARAAWTGTYGAGHSEPVRVEAAAWKGQFVYFNAGPASRQTGALANTPQGILAGILATFFVIVVVGATLIARHNLRVGRCDKKGAQRLAWTVFLSALGAWAIRASHVASYWELRMIFEAVASTGLVAALIGLCYLAAEPYVRRYWPDSLISWNRLQSGRLRDPLVASHVLVGIFTWFALFGITFPFWLFLPIREPEGIQLLSSPALMASFVAGFVSQVLVVMTALLLLVVALRLLTRRRLWIADVLGCILFGLTGPIVWETPFTFFLSAGFVIPAVYTVFWLVRRFGFVALLGAWVGRVSVGVPFEPTSWYSGLSLIPALIPVLLAALALWVIVNADRHKPESMV
jgi:serine/threonine-protein kinase